MPVPDDVQGVGTDTTPGAQEAAAADDKESAPEEVKKDVKEDDDALALYSDIDAKAQADGKNGDARGDDKPGSQRGAADMKDGDRGPDYRSRAERSERSSRERDTKDRRSHRDEQRHSYRDRGRDHNRSDRRDDYDRDGRSRRDDRGRDRERRRDGERDYRRRERDYDERRRDREYDRDRARHRDGGDERDRRREGEGGSRRGRHDGDDGRRRGREAEEERGRSSRGRDEDGDRSRDRRKEREGRDEYVLGGYRPRARGQTGHVVPQVMDPFAEIRKKNAAQGMAAATFAEAKKLQEEQRARARQMVLQQQATSAAAAASKTQREVYIGNLQQGKVTEQTLRQLFDEALGQAFPHLCTPGVLPVRAVAMHSEGRYAFVELHSSELATAALNLSGQLSFLGAQMTVGRPSGYIDPSKANAAAAAASRALQEFNADAGLGDVLLEKGEAPTASTAATECVCLDGMVTDLIIADEQEFQEMVEDLKEECGKHGEIVDMRIPKPPAGTALGEGCYGKVYMLMDAVEGARAIVQKFQGRQYDGRTLSASFAQVNHFYQLPLPGQEA